MEPLAYKKNEMALALWVMEDKAGESRTNAVNCGGQQV